MEREALLTMKGVNKFFPGVRALKDVDFEVARNEVHGLVGENGAGKSTLIKILTGLYQPDSGVIEFDGRIIAPQTPLAAQHEGISTIYQELNLIPHQTVYENIYLGREPLKKSGLLDREKMAADTRQVLSDMGLQIDVTRPLNSFSTAIQQMVAIARAITINCRLVVMDEPTSSLDTNEVKVLFEVIRRLLEKNISVVFISHRMDELLELCSRITVLKDGQKVATMDVGDVDKFQLVSLMIGRQYSSTKRTKKEKSYTGSKPVLQAKNVRQGMRLNGLNVEIHPGEIVGLAGLLGSGRTELAKILFGESRMDEGEVMFLDNPVEFKHPRFAIAMGMGFCSEDRKMEGIIPHLTVKENMSITTLPQISRHGVINQKKENEKVRKYIDILGIKTPGPNQLIRFLSGGNQQKVLLARWLCMDPNPALIILDEPTRGIDVGAKAEIENLIQRLSEQGIAILMISSELEELERNCDRAIVLREGRKMGELTGGDITQNNMMKMIATGGNENEEKEGGLSWGKR